MRSTMKIMAGFANKMLAALLLAFVITFLLAAVQALVAQVIDSVPGPVPPSGPINYAASLAIGLGASILTGVVGKGAKIIDTALGNADGWVRQKTGPFLPGIAVLAALGLREIGVQLDPTLAVSAPISAIIGITAREAVRKWVAPLAGRR